MLPTSLQRALGAIFLLSFGSSSSEAQFVRDHEIEGKLRGFHGVNTSSKIRRSFQSDAEARQELDRILTAIGLNQIGDRIILRASADTPNAEAGISEKGERFIFYNANFMQKLKQQTADQWPLISVLAHELGHHLAFHNEVNGRYHEFELEADYFSGFVLQKLGASLDQAESTIKTFTDREPTLTHPGVNDRIQAITLGWTEARTRISPGVLNVPMPASVGPPNVQPPTNNQLSLPSTSPNQSQPITEPRQPIGQPQKKQGPETSVTAPSKKQDGDKSSANGSEKQQSQASRRPDPLKFSHSVWGQGDIPSDMEVTATTKFGKLACVGGNNTTRYRKCFWK